LLVGWNIVLDGDGYYGRVLANESIGFPAKKEREGFAGCAELFTLET
jgi:hypothetical protein